MMIPSKDLVKFWDSALPFRKWAKLGISVKIMAPITQKNFRAAKQLLEFCEIRHVAASQLGTTVVDGKHLFQFKTPLTDQEGSESASSSETQFYSDDSEYVGKVKVMLDDLWKNAHAPSPITMESIIRSRTNGMSAFFDDSYIVSRSDSAYRKYAFIKLEEWPKAITEKEVMSKIINARKHPVKNPLKEKSIFYGKQASALIRPPDYLNLPKMIINIFHWKALIHVREL